MEQNALPAAKQPQQEFMKKFTAALSKLNNGNLHQSNRKEEYRWEHWQRDAPKIVRLYVPVLICVFAVLLSVANLDYYRVPVSSFNLVDILPHDNLQVDKSHFEFRTHRQRATELTPSEEHEAKKDVFSSVVVVFAVIGVVFLFLLCGTVSLLILYKLRLTTIIMVVSVVPYTVYLAILPLVYIQELVYTLNIALDWFLLCFFLYNQVVVGYVVLFDSGPKWIKQFYYVLISAMLALLIIKFMNEWIEIGLMVLLIIWDLYAVLSSKGPLITLLDTIQEGKNNQLMKPMVFQMMAWRQSSSRGRDVTNPSSLDSNVQMAPSPLEDFEMGLGDFIFYSVLIAKSYVYSGILGTILATLSLLIGLTVTLIILIISGYALPAIPIPVTLGLVAQLLTQYTANPFAESLNADIICI